MRLSFWLKTLLPRCRRTVRLTMPRRRRFHSGRASAFQPLSVWHCPEQLEDRTLLTSAISFLDGTLTIDIGADSEQTTLSVSGGTDLSITSSDGGGTTADAAAQALGFAATTATDEASTGSLSGGSPVTQIVINGASGTQTIVVGDGAFPALTAGSSSDIELITVTGDVTLGSSDLQLLATQTVALTTGSSIATIDGNVTLEGNVAATTSVDSVGVSLTNAVISTSGTGNITLTGRGGDGSGGGNQGVTIRSGAMIESTATGIDAGQILIVGTGGSGTSNNSGVVIVDAGSTLSTVDGAISVTGQGGTGSADANHGVQFIFGAKATSTGSGSTAGTITLIGTGGSGTSSNQGVLIHSTGSAVTSEDGDIVITGQGGAGSDSDNIGVFVFSDASVESTGTTSDAATISISGTGGSGTFSNIGVSLHTANARVESAHGSISITGQGGMASGDGNHGVQLFNGGSIVATETAAGAGTVTISGTGGTGASDEIGVLIDGTTTSIQAVAGQIEIRGTGGTGTSESHDGVRISNQATVQSTGKGSSAATIFINGRGGDGTRYNDGVEIGVSGGRVTSIDGNIQIQGTGGTAGTDGRSHGVNLSENASVTSTGTGTSAATITITGTGGRGGIADRGVTLSRAGATISSIDGDISLTGTGGGGGSDSYHVGVGIFLGARVESTGTGGDAATITISGTGGTEGTGSSFNRGVGVFDANSLVTSVDGKIVINGTGGNAGGGVNVGVQLFRGGQVTSTGTTADAATIMITGTAVAGDQFNRGVSFNDAGAGVSTIAGDVFIAGTAGPGNGDGHHGVFLFNGAFVESTGTGFGAGTIQIEGTGGGGLQQSGGVTVSTADSRITSVDGPISIVGHDGEVGGATNLGLEVIDTGRIESTGSTISVVADDGVNVDSTSQIASATGTTIDVDLDSDDLGTGGTVTIAGTVQSGTQTTIRTGSDGDSILYTPSTLTGATVINSGGGNDTVSADGAAAGVTINGGDGDDLLTGSAFDDVLNGEDGDDTLAGLGGLDQLTGGPGTDSFEDVARPLIVDTAADVDDGDYSAGNLSLREAVRLANESVDLDETISFDAALNGSTIVLAGGELPILNPVVINGPWATLLTIDAGDLSRVFNVDDGNSGMQIAVSISGLTLTRGMTAGNGGAIVNSENLTVNELTITGSSAMYGGGIYNSGVLTVTGSTLSGNSAESGGGILDEQATLIVTTSTIADNVATFQGAGVRLGRSNAVITDSSILRNTGSGEGGGIASYQSNLTVENSTLFGNETRGDGGGIFVGSGGAATVVQSTISGNRSGIDNTGADFKFGGGIRKRSGSLTIHNTIVAGNFRDRGTQPDDITGAVNTGTFNLIGDADSSGGLMDGVDGNIVGDMGVGVLDLTGVLDAVPSNHGGPTETFALPEGSIAIDAGDNVRAPSVNDQRGAGFDRIVDGDGDMAATVDIGSFEFVESSPPEPGPRVVTLVTPGSFELLVENGSLVLRDIQGTEFFREPESLVTQLRVNLSDGPDFLRVLNVDSPLLTPLKVDAGGGNDQVDALLALVSATLIGGSGDDTLTGGAFGDVLNGGAGADSLDGSTGNDRLRGQGGSGDVLRSSSGNDTLDGGSGNDLLMHAFGGNTTLSNSQLEGDGRDSLTSIELAVLNGSDADNRISARQFSGRVTINGGAGRDRLFGTNFGDVINGGDGDDSISGYSGDDRMNGGAGNDTIGGGAGRDTLIGEAGDDLLRGQGASGDVLSGGSGVDRLDGGKGNDRLVASSDAGFILTDTSLDDGTSVDVLVDLESAFLTGGDGGHRLDASAFSGWVHMTGGEGNDTLIGTALNDALAGRGGDDRIEGRGGADRLRGAAGRDLLFGGLGNDLLLGQGSSGDTLRGGDGLDTLDGGSGTDRIFDDGLDVITVDPLDNVVPA